MPAGQWAQELAQAVAMQDTLKLVAHLDSRNAVAQAAAQQLTMGRDALVATCSSRFRQARVPEADKWGVVAAEHLGAMQRQQAGDAAVRLAQDCAVAVNLCCHV